MKTKTITRTIRVTLPRDLRQRLKEGYQSRAAENRKLVHEWDHLSEEAWRNALD